MPRPASLRDLFWAFTWLALQGFGGVLAVVQRELVDKKQWLTREQFIEDWAVAQVLPGPNVLFVALLGWNLGLNAGGGIHGDLLTRLHLLWLLALGALLGGFGLI